MKKIFLLFSLALLLTLSSCNLFIQDGTISVSVSGIDQLAGFNPGTSDIYFFAYDTFSVDFVSGTKVDGFSGYDSTTAIGVPSFMFTGGESYYIDVYVDIDGDDDLDTGVVYWLTYYEEVTIEGDMVVYVNNYDFEVAP